MVSARRFASAEAVYASTAWSPEVSGSPAPRRAWIDPAAERDRPTVGRERRAEYRTIDVHHRVDRAPCHRDRVDVVIGRVVVRLGHAVGDEIDARTVATPLRGVLVERARRHLMGFRRLVAGRDTRHRPDVGVLAGGDIPFV